MINLIIESIIVAIYSVIIFWISGFIKNIYAKLFITGFIKHFLGYYSGLHTLYCNSKIYKSISILSFKELFIQSLIEGILFIILGYFIGHSYINIFFIGLILHIAFDILKIHKFYINNYCK